MEPPPHTGTDYLGRIAEAVLLGGKVHLVIGFLSMILK